MLAERRMTALLSSRVFRNLAVWSTLGVLALSSLPSAAMIPERAAHNLACPEPGATPAREACVRQELGIPPDAKRVAIVSQSSHLDWDWRHTFESYFEGPLDDPLLFLFPGSVDTILSDAVGLMVPAHGAKAHYYYSVAEMGFLARFVEAHPDLIAPLRAVGHDLRIVGGGITSPDSLLPPGESFIRDYLVGKTWVDATLGLPIRQAWLPDDFGHDSQLPIVLEAMGLDGVGFGRVPGVDTTLKSIGFEAPAEGTVAADLLHDGLDFVWRAADGSSALAHWMPGGYCQGDWVLGAVPGREPAGAFDRLIATDGAASRTPYIFIPVGCDFARPRPNLLDLVDAWNAHDYARTGVWLVAATFDHYVQLVTAHRAALPIRRFDPTPYWTGFYATRPLLKGMHLRATQALLAAETFGAIADAAGRRHPENWLAGVRARTAAIHAGWETLVPANHHDFVTGTALDPVYEDEQLPRLTAALTTGEGERTRAFGEIVAAIRPRAGNEAGTVVVFNPLGFERRGLVEVNGADTAQAAGRRSHGLEQASAEGGRLFLARVPSLGYATEDLSHTAVPGRASLVVEPDGTAAVLENAFLRATVRQDTGWGITSLIDKHSGKEIIGPGQVANALVPYADEGGLYRFGSEMQGCSLEPLSGAATGGAPTVLERGPLRARVVAQTIVDGRPFQKEYQLVAGEPFLRMISTGSAAPGTSVMVHFPLEAPIDSLIHGTPYHWDRKLPERAGPFTFEATHGFLVPQFNGRARVAIFHAGVPAWAVRRDGLVIGALWRNANKEHCDLYGAEGTDTHEVAVSYAIRIPSGVRGPRSGGELREALAFETPLLAAAGRPSGHLPRRFSLASARPGSAILTAAKAGTEDASALILRVYQPTNTPLRVVVRTGARRRFPVRRKLVVGGMTALETRLRAERAAGLDLKGQSSRFSFLARRALTTIAVRSDGAGESAPASR
jgi:alpha-mannosidase